MQCPCASLEYVMDDGSILFICLFSVLCMLCVWWSMRSECLALGSAERGIWAKPGQRGENCSFSKRDLVWCIKKWGKDIKETPAPVGSKSTSGVMEVTFLVTGKKGKIVLLTKDS